MTYHIDKSDGWKIVEGSTQTPLYWIGYIGLCIIALIIFYNLWLKHFFRALINWIKYWSKRRE